jgi:uncharacterized membrane protein YqiK
LTIAIIGLIPTIINYSLGVIYIPNNKIGIVEKLWSNNGSVRNGHLISLKNEAGYQADILRGGFHFYLWQWQYKIHKESLVTVPSGKIGYIYARDGQNLEATQTLGREKECNHFQDIRKFLSCQNVDQSDCGQKGRQRSFLREGVYAVNLAMFVVITNENVYSLNIDSDDECKTIEHWYDELAEVDGFSPIIIESKHYVDNKEPESSPLVQGIVHYKSSDSIGIVAIHDGPSLESGEVIAPMVGTSSDKENYHNNFQDIERFFKAGGKRGKQLQTLTDGTYFINRWFATIEVMPKTVVPIGHVGVVVSYHGKSGKDLSGIAFKHGEIVLEDERGVWSKTLGPGKYPFNLYAGIVHLVPTTNFVLHWITGKSETHRFDENLMSIELVTADAYEPILPLSIVVHIDYQKAPSVVQRFGDIKKLITQTLDPLLSAYFRDIAHKKTMLQLLHERDLIQKEAYLELHAKFSIFDIELVDVLIGKPSSKPGDKEIDNLLQQLRIRQLAKEQVETYEQQRLASVKQKELENAKAIAQKQTELTESQVSIQIAENNGNAKLSAARKEAEQMVVTAKANNERMILEAEADSRSLILIGEGQSQKTTMEGEAESSIQKLKILSYGDPKLYAMSLLAKEISNSKQPLVPQKLFITGGQTSETGNGNILTTLLNLLVAEKSESFNDTISKE